MSAPSAPRLTVDLDSLAHNYATLRAEAPGAEAAPVVKANGYGLGATPIARRLWAEGARSFFVARTAEGEALRMGLGSDRPAVIYVLDGFVAGAGPRLAASALTPVLSSPLQVEAAASFAAARAQPLPVAMQIDTGMNRQGVTLGQAEALAETSDRLAGLELGLVMSHLGSATEPAHPRNHDQQERFARVRRLFPRARASFAASAGIMLGPDYRFDMVRPGISLYGGGPEERPDPRLRAVARLEAPILYLRDVDAGEMIGYGSTMVVDRPTRVAIVAAGYADGLIRAAKGRSYGWFAGARRRVLIVAMDMIALDIGDADARPGDWIELLGPNVLIDDVAAAADTVAHECLVRLGGRAERIYLGEV
jgi:alanine racemase